MATLLKQWKDRKTGKTIIPDYPLLKLDFRTTLSPAKAKLVVDEIDTIKRYLAMIAKAKPNPDATPSERVSTSANETTF